MSVELILHLNQEYDLQCHIDTNPLFIKTCTVSILSAVAYDIYGKPIEVIAFNDEAEYYYKHLMKDGNYHIQNAISIHNEKYKKTKHQFKLKLTNQTRIHVYKSKQYIRKKLVCVETKSKKKKDATNIHQTSISNWFKPIKKYKNLN